MNHKGFMNKITISDTTLNIFIRNNADIFGEKTAMQLKPYSDDILQEALNIYVSKYRGCDYGTNGSAMGNKKYTFEI